MARALHSAVVFEQYQGAASAPLPARYRPRQPQKTVLHQLVREHVQTMLAEAALRTEDGRGYPRFVEREFRRYLDCGSLGRGFARVRCRRCGFERLLAFSCKGRLCPSCQARRMHDVALHLAEQVVPSVPLRQWVLTVPRALRFTLTRDHQLRRDLVSILVRSIFMLQRRQARADGWAKVLPGAITFLHEAGSALNLNPHSHSLLPDAVFVVEPERQAVFVELPPPSSAQLERLLATVIRRFQRSLRSAPGAERDSEAELDDDPLAQLQAQAVQLSLQPTPRGEPASAPPPEPLCARQQGFSLHAGVTVAAGDEQGRLRLLRYGARAALSCQLLSLLPDGRVRYQLRRTAGPGSPEALVLQPTELLHRLAATLPRPYQHRTLYHGVFAPAASFRLQISRAASRSPRRDRACLPSLPPGPGALGQLYRLEPYPPAPAAVTAAPDAPDAGTGAPLAGNADTQALVRFCCPARRPPSGRFPWAELISRTFPDALVCPNCQGALSVIAYLTEITVLRKILRHLGLPTDTPEPAPARLPSQLDWDLDGHRSDCGDLDSESSAGRPRRAARGPPQSDDSGL